MEKCIAAYFGQFEVRREQPLQQQLSDVIAAGCRAPPMVNTERLEHVKTSNVGHGQDFIYSTQRAAVSAKNIVLQNIIHYCTVNLHFPTLCLWSKDG